MHRCRLQSARCYCARSEDARRANSTATGFMTHLRHLGLTRRSLFSLSCRTNGNGLVARRFTIPARRGTPVRATGLASFCTALSPPLTQLPQSYFAFKPNMLSPSGGNGSVTALADPFGNAYGYSTANQYDQNTGFNPTFDLWSTAGAAPSPTPIPPATQQNLWIKNW